MLYQSTAASIRLRSQAELGSETARQQAGSSARERDHFHTGEDRTEVLSYRLLLVFIVDDFERGIFDELALRFRRGAIGRSALGRRLGTTGLLSGARRLLVHRAGGFVPRGVQ